MNVIIISTKSMFYPVGIAYISAAIRRAGHRVDCHVLENPDRLAHILENGKYHLAAAGGLSSQYNELKAVSDIVRKSGTKLVLGGGIITSEPELMSRALGADYVVIGEGETTIVELLSALRDGADLSTVDGIGYFEEGRFVRTRNRKQDDNLDALPFPDYEGFGFMETLEAARPSDIYYLDIFDHPREYPIVMSRSCPYLCTFCYHPTGEKYRQRSIASVMEELRTVIPKYRINIVSIYDELFSYDEERVRAFCREFKSFTDTLSWKVAWSCQMRVSGLKDEMLDAMRDAGCYALSYGFESYSPTVLKSMRKGITPEQIHHAVHATLDRNISIQANFIFGDKAETLQTARETLDFWNEHRDAGIILAFIFACPDSELYRHCIREGIIKDRLHFIKYDLFKIFNMTRMADAEFFRLRALVYRYNHSRMFDVVPMEKTSYSVTVQCPHCRETIRYGNYSIPERIYRRMAYCRNCRKRFHIASKGFRAMARVKSALSTPVIYRTAIFLAEFRNRLSAFLRGRYRERDKEPGTCAARQDG